MKQLELIDLDTVFKVHYESSKGFIESKTFKDILELDLYLKKHKVSDEELQEMSDNLYELDLEDKEGRIFRNNNFTVYKKIIKEIGYHI